VRESLSLKEAGKILRVWCVPNVAKCNSLAGLWSIGCGCRTRESGRTDGRVRPGVQAMAWSPAPPDLDEFASTVLGQRVRV